MGLPGEQICLKIKLLIKDSEVKDRIDSYENKYTNQYDEKGPVHSSEN